jgi:hypothetical protein
MRRIQKEDQHYYTLLCLLEMVSFSNMKQTLTLKSCFRTYGQKSNRSHQIRWYITSLHVTLIIPNTGILVDVTNNDLNTPLHHFCQKFKSTKCQEPFYLMLAKGARVNAENKAGNSLQLKIFCLLNAR